MTKRQAAILIELTDRLHAQGSWCAETTLHKTGYFLQELLGVDMGMEFILYKHGPFSFDLRDTIGAMLGYRLLDMRVNRPPYGPSWLPSNNSRRLINVDAHVSDREKKAIEFVARSLAAKGVVELEKLGTALHVTKQHPDWSLERRAREMHRLKPHVTVPEAQVALHEVERVRQAAQQEGLVQ